MTRFGDYDYNFFGEYQADVLSQRPAIEQLILLDDEVANKIVITRYEGPVDPVEWNSLEQYYSGLFTDFITERIEGSSTRHQLNRTENASISSAKTSSNSIRNSPLNGPHEQMFCPDQLKQSY